MKIDPYNHKEKYLEWKKALNGKIPEVSSQNSKLILSYLEDMEVGLNVAVGSRKGSRSYIRLNSVKVRLTFFAKQFNALYGLKKITDINETQIHSFFTKMSNGTIKKQNGEPYKATADYVKDFKAFWHWWQKTNKKKGIKIEDITTDLDTSKEKPKWVYLTEDQVRLMSDEAKYKYKVLIMFLFDTGIRAPTELVNIKVSDLYNNCKELIIRDEVSKTFGRRIKLMICSNLLKEYIKTNNLRHDDLLFNIVPASTNQYLKRLAKKLFGDEKSLAGEKYSNLTMYDFRHCSCCYWLPRYKSESAIKFRFGWKKSEKIHYYSEMLGMRDTIEEEDLLIDVTKTEIERRLLQSEKDKQILQERINTLENQMKAILKLVDENRRIVEIS